MIVDIDIYASIKKIAPNKWKSEALNTLQLRFFKKQLKSLLRYRYVLEQIFPLFKASIILLTVHSALKVDQFLLKSY